MTRSAISRLENHWNNNPTVETLYRYANAVGVPIGFVVRTPETLGETADTVGRLMARKMNEVARDVIVPEEPKRTAKGRKSRVG